jgi:hypothetical protein
MQLSLPRRYFRRWVPVDRLVPPENMTRCMANTYRRLTPGAHGTACILLVLTPALSLSRISPARQVIGYSLLRYMLR